MRSTKRHISTSIYKYIIFVHSNINQMKHVQEKCLKNFQNRILIIVHKQKTLFIPMYVCTYVMYSKVFTYCIHEFEYLGKFILFRRSSSPIKVMYHFSACLGICNKRLLGQVYNIVTEINVCKQYIYNIKLYTMINCMALLLFGHFVALVSGRSYEG